MGSDESLTAENLTHFEINPYTFESTKIGLQDLSLLPNFWRGFKPHRSADGEFLHEYYVELNPAHVGYRAMLLNAQFMGRLVNLMHTELCFRVT